MKEKISAFFKGDLDNSPEILSSHSHDASLFEITPELVAFPKDVEDIQSLVRFVAEEKKTNPKISITARSAGTCMAGGSLNDSIILDGMKYINTISEVKRVTPYASLPHFPGAKPVKITGEAKIQPGVFYRDFEVETLKQGLVLPCFTASKSINALGGMIGNNSGGELSLKYGKTEDYVKDVEVVFADGSKESIYEMTRRQADFRAHKDDYVGRIYRDVLHLIDNNRAFIESKRPQVSKNSAGYNIWNVSRRNDHGEEMIDLSQLIVGSEGTLGITTGATLKLVDTKKHKALLVIFLTDLADLAQVVVEARTVDPETVEAYDDKTIQLAVKFWRGFIKKRGFWGAIKLGLSFVPEFGMMLGGMPKLVLLVECAGTDEQEVLARVELLKKRMEKFKHATTRIAKNADEAEKYWMIRHDSFALLREHFKGKRTAPFVDDVVVPPERLPEFVPALRDILESHKLSYNIHGHAGSGNFHIIPLIDTDARLSEKMILDVSSEVYALVLKLGGSITAEHNDGIIRTPFLVDMFGDEMIGIFTEIKKIFDPQNIFNPGKKVGLTKKDIGKYLIHGQ